MEETDECKARNESFVNINDAVNALVMAEIDECKARNESFVNINDAVKMAGGNNG